MKSLEKKVPVSEDSSKLNEEEELDLELAFAIAKKLLVEGGGLKVIEDAVHGSQDPAAVIGQFFAQLFGQLHESFPPDMEVSPRVYLARGGVLEQLLDFLEEKLGLPRTFSDEVFGAVVETIKAAAMNPEQAQGGQAQPAQDQAPMANPAEAMPQQQGVL